MIRAQCLLLTALAWLNLFHVLSRDPTDTASFMAVLGNLRPQNISGTRAMTPFKLHLLRIPKAGSSSLSVVVRRLAGCFPAGPCCRYPGNPKGSCSAPQHSPSQLACDKVIGCMGHNPHAEILFHPTDTILTISTIREPIARALSAFSYHPPHTNCILGNCTNTSGHLIDFMHSPRYQNVAVKMLTGDHPYRSNATCRVNCHNSLRKAIRNMETIAFMGVSELWPISMLLLHIKLPYFTVDSSDFDPYSFDSRDRREHAGIEYETFVTTARLVHKTSLELQNRLDIELYKVALINLCRDLQRFNLWNKFSIVKNYWRGHVPKGYESVATECA